MTSKSIAVSADSCHKDLTERPIQLFLFAMDDILFDTSINDSYELLIAPPFFFLNSKSAIAQIQ